MHGAAGPNRHARFAHSLTHRITTLNVSTSGTSDSSMSVHRGPFSERIVSGSRLRRIESSNMLKWSTTLGGSGAYIRSISIASKRNVISGTNALRTSFNSVTFGCARSLPSSSVKNESRVMKLGAMHSVSMSVPAE